MDGFDFWAISFKQSEIHQTGNPAEIKYSLKQKRCSILYEVIKKAYKEGSLKEPVAMRDGIDFVTKVQTSMSKQSDPNFKYTRGFVNPVYEHFGTKSRIPLDPSMAVNTWFTVGQFKPGGEHDYFLTYVRAAMFYPEDEFYKEHPKEKYPLVSEKYEMVVEHVKNVLGLDLKKIAEGPQK